MSFALHAADVVVPVVTPPVEDGAVVTDGPRIVAVGPRERLEREYGDRVSVMHRHRGTLTPGLVNAHTHLQQTRLSEMATLDAPFDEWIGRFLAIYAATTTEQWLDGARDGVRQSLRAGVTAVADVDTHDQANRAIAEAGLQGIAYVEVVGVDDTKWPTVRPVIERRLDGRGTHEIGLSPHTLYTVSTSALRDVAALARERGLRLHPHVAETLAECEFVAEGTGRLAAHAERGGLTLDLAGCGCGATPVRRLDDLGLLGPDVHVAHGVHVDAADRALLRERGTAVALCPRSNALLRAGTAPVADYLREGNPIAVGTDGRASSPDLDVWGDVAALRRLAREQGYDGGDLDRRLVEAATLGGARAIGLAATHGHLAPGARADLAVFAVPTDDEPHAALVAHAHGRCTATVLGGEIVHEEAA